MQHVTHTDGWAGGGVLSFGGVGDGGVRLDTPRPPAGAVALLRADLTRGSETGTVRWHILPRGRGSREVRTGQAGGGRARWGDTPTPGALNLANPH